MLIRQLFICMMLLSCGGLLGCGNPPDPTDSDAGRRDCDGGVRDDPNHCGACGRVCPHLTGTSVACSAGECVYTCTPGFADCDGDLAGPTTNGCEVDLDSDLLHCGDCTTSCTAALPNAEASCGDGICGVRCESGFGDCNGDIVSPSSDGCETDTTASSTHCGVCRNACAGPCVSSTCEGESRLCEYVVSEIEQPVSIRLASNGSTFLAAWNDLSRRRLFVLPLDGAGREAGPVREVTAFESHWRFGLGYDGSGFVLVWEDEGANAVFAQSLAASGDAMGAPRRLRDGAATSIRVSDAPGEVLVTVEGAGFRVRGGEVTPFTGPGDDFATAAAVTAEVADGYAAVGVVRVYPSPERPYDYRSLDYGTYDAGLATRGGGALDRSFHLYLGSRAPVAFVSLGDGALLLAGGSSMMFGTPELRVLPFDRRGNPEGGLAPMWRTVEVAPSEFAPLVFALTPRDGTTVWMASTSNSPSARDPIDVRAIGAAGETRAGPFTAALPRAGSIEELALAANDHGVLVVWSWASSTPWAHAIEGAFVHNDGTVEPCAP